MSNSYYRAFTKPHVHLETSGIERIEPDGIVACDGTKRFIDTLVLATGYDVWDANMPAIEVIGRDGRDLGKWWRDTRFQAYQGISVPYFPNFLTMASPYAWVGLSWFNTVEYQMRHMNRLFGELQRRGARTFEVTEQANARFLDRMDRAARQIGVLCRQLCDLAVVLVQPQRGGTAFPADVGAQRRQGAGPIPVERLLNSMTPRVLRHCRHWPEWVLPEVARCLRSCTATVTNASMPADVGLHRRVRSGLMAVPHCRQVPLDTTHPM